MRLKVAILVVSLLLIVAAPSPSLAHHSVSMYDMANPTTVAGVVERVEWTNPHTYVYLLAKNDKGVVEEWAMELNSPNFLKHNGWTNSMVKAGDTLTCTGGRAKDGARSMRVTGVKLANGLELRS
jgi:hypothetical protein